VLADGRSRSPRRSSIIGPWCQALAFRFDAPDRSIVISGDTAPSPNLVALARGADVLVHSVMFRRPSIGSWRALPNAAALKASILQHQYVGLGTRAAWRRRPASDARSFATCATGRSELTDAMWMAAAQRHFRGRVVVGKDLMEV
jgi:hypothetical protein